MKTLRNTFLLFVVFVAILSGCATGKFVMKDSMLGSKPSEVNLLMEPYQSLGLLETEAVRTGQTTVVQGKFPEILFGEYFPGRIRWNVWGVDENGREYFGQALFSGIAFTGDFLWTIVMDGNVPDSVPLIVLASGLDFGYDLLGEEIPLEPKFVRDRAYRQKIILAKGTKVGDMRKITGFQKVTADWNSYRTPEGVLLSPLGDNEVRLIASINPQYHWTEKMVGEGHFSVFASYIGTAVGIGIEVFRSANGSIPSTGWDYNSQLPNRRNMAFIIKYVSALKQNLIENINGANKSLVMEKRRLQ
jgi:hypothetical protein